MGEYYILDENDKPVLEKDLIAWAKWFEENIKRKRVVLTELNGPEDIKVSTVFVGLNHNFGRGEPLLYKTIVFGGELDNEMDRYATKEQALKGHKRMVNRVILSIKEKENAKQDGETT